MAMTNAERQRRYIKKLKRTARTASEDKAEIRLLKAELRAVQKRATALGYEVAPILNAQTTPRWMLMKLGAEGTPIGGEGMKYRDLGIVHAVLDQIEQGRIPPEAPGLWSRTPAFCRKPAIV
jgi:hypothetical protein